MYIYTAPERAGCCGLAGPTASSSVCTYNYIYIYAYVRMYIMYIGKPEE